MTWDKQLQLSNMTCPNRFPRILESAKKLKPDAKRILSFGCSIGEECFSLADKFPEAEIVGIDISHYSIQRARSNNKYGSRVNFHDYIGATGKYDLVTCLMVLFSLDRPLEFERWDIVLNEIHQHINLDGLLMIFTSEYDFLRAEIANDYEVIRSWTRIHPKNEKEYFCGYYKKNNESYKKRIERREIL